MCGVEREELARETSLQDGGLSPRSSHKSRDPRSSCPADGLEKTQETHLTWPEVSVEGTGVCV